MRLAIALALLLVSQAASAASFDCKKAATVTEKAICADAPLSSLDERATTAYTDAVTDLGVSDDERDPVGALLLKGHEEFSAARARCGAATNCLLQTYLRRLAVLSYKPDNQARSPVDALIGRYGTPVEPPRELVIMAAPGGTALVHVGVNATDWTCSFNGIGRLDKNGDLRVTHSDYDNTTQGDHAIILTHTRLGLAVTAADKRDDALTRFCGAGGSIDQPYPRKS